MRRLDVYKTVKNWDELVGLETEFAISGEEWVFRGESKSRAPKTTLQRVCEEFGIRRAQIPSLETKLVQDFSRRYAIYEKACIPDYDDTIYWLSLMRHYGAPTRFLDFTYSFFIATFFALETPTEARGERGQYEPAAVWAISKSWLTELSAKLMNRIGGLRLCRGWGKRKGWAFRKVFWEQRPPQRTVFPVNPYRSHERLDLQQGLFLCPGDVSVSFEENLLELPDYQDNVRLVSIESSCRADVLRKLQKAGLNRALLFPGLDGFAKSLCTTTPLIFLDQKKLEKKRTRVPTNSRGEFLWKRYLSWFAKRSPNRGSSMKG